MKKIKKRYFEVRNVKWDVEVRILDILISKVQKFNLSLLTSNFKNSRLALLTSKNRNQTGFSSLAFLTVLGLFLAVTLALIGTGTIKLPGNANLAVSPIPISDPIEDDEACSDPYNAECDPYLDNDPEDMTPAQIQSELEKN